MPVTRDNLHEVFKYYAPKEGQTEQYEAIRKAGYDFANAILTLTPSCADQQAALRLVREACMTANAATAQTTVPEKGRLEMTDWPTINRRRGELIDRQIDGTLTTDEQAELATLQNYADAHLAPFIEAKMQYSIPTTGDPEEDQRQLDSFILHSQRMEKNICPNGCGAMNWLDAHNRECVKCGFQGFSSKPFDMQSGNA